MARREHGQAAGETRPARPGHAGDHRPERLTAPERLRARRLARRLARRERNRQRILRTTAILPSLFTISNGLLGFASAYLALREGVGAAAPNELMAAALLLFGAMVCDMLDGRIARFTRRTSDFGGQLDSLADVISFGMAPGVLMLATVMGVVHDRMGDLAAHVRLGQLGYERAMWCVAAAFLACAALRLARFNVENEPDESAHMDFRGLPSPGAAAAVASLVMLYVHLDESRATRPTAWLLGPAVQSIAPGFQLVVAAVLPAVTLLCGLLMVSSFRYVHLVNRYVRGRRPFNYLVWAVILGLIAMLEPHVALAGGTLTYALWPPGRAIWRRWRRRGTHTPQADQAHAPNDLLPPHDDDQPTS